MSLNMLALRWIMKKYTNILCHSTSRSGRHKISHAFFYEYVRWIAAMQVRFVFAQNATQTLTLLARVPPSVLPREQEMDSELFASIPRTRAHINFIATRFPSSISSLPFTRPGSAKSWKSEDSAIS